MKGSFVAAGLCALLALAGAAPAPAASRTYAALAGPGLVDVRHVDSAAAVAAPAVATLAGENRAVLWRYDDVNATADGLGIDGGRVWASWRYTDGRLTAHTIAGDGTPALQFGAFDALFMAGVASARGGDRVVYLETGPNLDDYRLHSFTSASAGTPDWSFEVPMAAPLGPAISYKNISVSRDGSTAALALHDTDLASSTLYVFDADTGAVTRTWTVPDWMLGVDLTDDGTLALVTHTNLATVIDTATGAIVFQVPASGFDVYYRLSGDGSVLVIGNNELKIYRRSGGSYAPIVELARPNHSFEAATAVSRDGSTVAVAAKNWNTNFLHAEIILFDGATGELLGSHFVEGRGTLQGNIVDAAISDDGSVFAFASWGTEFHDWPEVMAFNRDLELIGRIPFAGSAFAVAVSADGRYVAGGGKAVHANTPGGGGKVELIEILPGDQPIPVITALDPETAVVGGSELTLTVTGTGFRPGSVVRFAGADRPTGFVDTTTLTTTLPASDLAALGTFPITVFTPAPGGGESDDAPFEVVPVPPPTIAIEPADGLSAVLAPGASETQVLAIANTGGEPLEWTITEEDRFAGALLGAHGRVTAPHTHAPAGPVVGFAGSAATRGRDESITPPFAPAGGETTLSHSASMAILASNTVACTPDGGISTNENHFLRTFTLTDFGIFTAFDVDAVTFAVQSLTGAADIGVNLYTLDGDFVFANLTPIGSATASLNAQTATLVTVPVTGTVSAGATLVVEIAAPDLSPSGIGFWPGSNDEGETAPSYAAAPGCGAPEPASFASIGFPHVHLVMAVTGVAEPLDCTLPAWIDVAPAGGTVPAGQTQSVDVTFDAAGLAPGEYAANLCLASNDPQRPLVVAPLRLAADVLFRDGFEP